MKKAAIVLILIMGIIFNVFCQSSGPMDLVVLLDTSTSMSNSYQETSDYLIGPFLKEFLRIGDTFHLISFAETPKLEISRRVEAAGDVEAVIGRLLLMYPLDPGSNVSGALNFAETYTSSLPGNRHRKLVLITDGDTPDTQNIVDAASSRFSGRNMSLQYIKVPVAGNGPSSGRPAQTARSAPPPSAAAPAPSPARQPQSAPTQPPARETPSQPAQGVPSAAGPVQRAPEAAVSSRPASPPPVSPVQSSSQASPSGQTTQPSPAPAQAAETPAAPESPSRTETFPPAQTPSGGSSVSSTVPPEPGRVPSTPAAQPSSGQDSVSPASSSQPPQTADPASGTIRPPSPAQSTPAQTGQQSRAVSQSDNSGSSFSSDIPLPLLIALALLALLILGLIIFFAAKRLHDSPNRVMAQAAAPLDARDRIEAQRQERLRSAEMMDNFAENQRKNARPPLEYPPSQRKSMPRDKVYTESPVDEGPLMLNLFVEDQNTAIGRRNIHVVKGGYTFSVGGGRSDFLIFLVPIPPHIADVQYDGRNCTFIPRKPQYFPDIGSQQVSNCIGKTIRVISDRNYELFVRIERYQDPLKALNNLLHSISVPGEVK